MNPRFFIRDLGESKRVALSEDVARHLHVLGLKPGDAITLFDGGGDETLARIESISRRSAQASVLSRQSVCREPGVRVTLACAVPKGRRMDDLVRMTAELGVHRIVPLITKRSVVKPSEARSGKGLRWDAICIAASEQSGRNRITVIDPPASFESFIARVDRDALTILLSPDENAPMLVDLLDEWWRKHSCSRSGGKQECSPHHDNDESSNLDRLTLIIGPEGGFTDDELALARSSGVRFARLTPSILRIETAAVAAVAIAVTSGLRPEA